MLNVRRIARSRVTFLLILAATAAPSTATAELSHGDCLLTDVAVNYANAGPLGGTATFSFGAGPAGTICAPAIPGSTTTTVSLGSTFTSSVLAKTCEITWALGTYSMNWGSTWGPSIGDFEFIGGAAGGVITLLDTDTPITVGVVHLTLSPLSGTNVGEIIDCAGNDMDTLHYVGELTFFDP